MRYVKKPVVVEAWKTGSDEPMPDWLREAFEREEVVCRVDETMDVKSGKLPVIMYIIDTLEGTMTCGQGDYIIKGVHGELYPCRGDIFYETYSPVQSTTIEELEKKKERDFHSLLAKGTHCIPSKEG